MKEDIDGLRAELEAFKKDTALALGFEPSPSHPETTIISAIRSLKIDAAYGNKALLKEKDELTKKNEQVRIELDELKKREVNLIQALAFVVGLVRASEDCSHEKQGF